MYSLNGIALLKNNLLFVRTIAPFPRICFPPFDFSPKKFALVVAPIISFLSNLSLMYPLSLFRIDLTTKLTEHDHDNRCAHVQAN